VAAIHRTELVLLAPTRPTANASDAAPVPPPASTAPRRFELTHDKPVDVGGGTTVVRKSVMYAHLSGSRNRSMLTMEVARGDKREQVYVGPAGATGLDARAADPRAPRVIL
jgi:hypothetical protein